MKRAVVVGLLLVGLVVLPLGYGALLRAAPRDVLTCGPGLTCTVETPGILQVGIAKSTPTPAITPDNINVDADWYAPPESVSFHARGLVGELSWPDGKMRFEGDAEASAQAFFDGALKDLVDEYIAARCGGGARP